MPFLNESGEYQVIPNDEKNADANKPYEIQREHHWLFAPRDGANIGAGKGSG